MLLESSISPGAAVTLGDLTIEEDAFAITTFDLQSVLGDTLADGDLSVGVVVEDSAGGPLAISRLAFTLDTVYDQFKGIYGS